MMRETLPFATKIPATSNVPRRGRRYRKTLPKWQVLHRTVSFYALPRPCLRPSYFSQTFKTGEHPRGSILVCYKNSLFREKYPSRHVIDPS